jgi:hypothetical protein
MKSHPNDCKWVSSIMNYQRERNAVVRGRSMFSGDLEIKLDIGTNIKTKRSHPAYTSFDLVTMLDGEFKERFPGYDYTQRPLIMSYFLGSMNEQTTFGYKNRTTVPGTLQIDARTSNTGRLQQTGCNRGLEVVKVYNKSYHSFKGTYNGEFNTVPTSFSNLRRHGSHMPDIHTVLKGNASIAEIIRFEYTIVLTDKMVHEQRQGMSDISKAIAHAKQVHENLKRCIVIVEVPFPFVTRSFQLNNAQYLPYFVGKTDRSGVTKRDRFVYTSLANVLGIFPKEGQSVMKGSPDDIQAKFIKDNAKWCNLQTLTGFWNEPQNAIPQINLVPQLGQLEALLDEAVTYPYELGNDEYHVITSNPIKYKALSYLDVREATQGVNAASYNMMYRRAGVLVRQRRRFEEYLARFLVPNNNITEARVKIILRDGPQDKEEKRILLKFLSLVAEEEKPDLERIAKESQFKWQYSFGRVVANSRDVEKMGRYGTRHEYGPTGKENLTPIAPEELPEDVLRNLTDAERHRAMSRLLIMNFQKYQEWRMKRYALDKKIGLWDAIRHHQLTHPDAFLTESDVLDFRDNFRAQKDGEEGEQLGPPPADIRTLEEYIQLENQLLQAELEAEAANVTDDGTEPGNDNDDEEEEEVNRTDERIVLDILQWAKFSETPRSTVSRYFVNKKVGRGRAFAAPTKRELAVKIEALHKDHWREFIAHKSPHVNDSPNPVDVADLL